MTGFSSPPFGRRSFLAVVGTAAVAGCIGDDELERVPDEYDHPTPATDSDWEPAVGSPLENIRIETVVENLEIPWDVTFTSDDELFLTQRTGSVLRFDAGDVTEVTRPRDAIDAEAVEPGTDEQPWWVEGAEGGTLGIAAHPDYPDPSHVYVYYTADDGDLRNRVVRYDTSASDPEGTERPIVDDIPADEEFGVHHGGRIDFGPDGNLWICTGDAHDPDRARDLSSLAGKILRVSPEGEPLETNPDIDGDPRIFTYGHRNPQGIDWLPDGVPVITEHGPTARDEIQVLRPGGDYGWDDVRGPPGDGEYGTYPDNSGVVPPVVHTGTRTTWAPTGATFYTGNSVPAWRNRYIVGGLASQSIFVVTLSPPGVEIPPAEDGNAWQFDADWLDDTYTATAHRVLHDELGRVRHVTESPSGELYAVTSNRDGRAEEPFPRERDDVLVRLTTV